MERGVHPFPSFGGKHPYPHVISSQGLVGFPNHLKEFRSSLSNPQIEKEFKNQMKLNKLFLLLNKQKKKIKEQTFSCFSMKIFFSSFLQVWILFLCLQRGKNSLIWHQAKSQNQVQVLLLLQLMGRNWYHQRANGVSICRWLGPPRMPVPLDRLSNEQSVTRWTPNMPRVRWSEIHLKS